MSDRDIAIVYSRLAADGRVWRLNGSRCRNLPFAVRPGVRPLCLETSRSLAAKLMRPPASTRDWPAAASSGVELVLPIHQRRTSERTPRRKADGCQLCACTLTKRQHTRKQHPGLGAWSGTGWCGVRAAFSNRRLMHSQPAERRRSRSCSGLLGRSVTLNSGSGGASPGTVSNS